ncbi:MAG: head-tail connector protein [Pseudomonadota bacterium]
MTLQLHTAAGTLPVSLVEAKLHLRVDGSDEDALITSLIGAAVLDAEQLMGRALMPQKWLLSLDAFPGSVCVPGQTIDLLRPPITAVDYIKYVSADDGTLTTLSPSVYQLAKASDYLARVALAYGQSWPSARSQLEAVQVLFSCGYADAASVPELIKAWIKLRVGSLFAHREQWTAGEKIERNEHVDYMLDRYRTWLL